MVELRVSYGFMAGSNAADGRRLGAGDRAHEPENVVRRVWGSPDVIMLVFAGSAAEFAVNKAVDWLFWTNALLNAPIERFFETVQFAQAMIFGDDATLAAAIDGVNRAHAGVERSRGADIPQWAYRDVLFMLIDYGERAYEIVYGPMTEAERLAFFSWSIAIGRRMHIAGLPDSYAEYLDARREHLRHDTAHTEFTDRLYASYRKHLGGVRYQALLDLQGAIVPDEVARILNLKRQRRVDHLLRYYHRLRRPSLLRWLYPIMLPRPFGARLARLERT